MSRILSTILLGLTLTALAAGDQSDIDLVILDNQQRIPGKLDEDPESADWVLIKTINGTLRLRKSRIAAVELGVTSRFKALKDDDLDGLIAFARWARSKGQHVAALAALDKAFNLIRINPKRPFDLSALALYARITDELKGPEAALPLYRWYRSYGGKDSDTLARLDQLEAIVGRSDETGVPPAPAVAAPVVLPEPEKPLASNASEGLETKGWQAENPQYSNPVQSEVVPLIGDEALAGVKRALKVTFGKGDKDKAALKKPVNLDASAEHVLSFQVRKQDKGSIRVAIAVKTGNWVYYESTIQTVKADDGWKELRFDLKAATFKCQKSEWANTATIGDLDEVKEIQVLLYNRDGDGSALISGMRFLSDKEL
jgi:hypothetical protein